MQRSTPRRTQPDEGSSRQSLQAFIRSTLFFLFLFSKKHQPSALVGRVARWCGECGVKKQAVVVAVGGRGAAALWGCKWRCRCGCGSGGAKQWWWQWSGEGAGGGASVVELGGSGRSCYASTQLLFATFSCLNCQVTFHSNCYKLVRGPDSKWSSQKVGTQRKLWQETRVRHLLEAPRATDQHSPQISQSEKTQHLHQV